MKHAQSCTKVRASVPFIRQLKICMLKGCELILTEGHFCVIVAFNGPAVPLAHKGLPAHTVLAPYTEQRL